MPVAAELSEFAPTTRAELARFLKSNAEGERRGILPFGGRTALPPTPSASSCVALAMGRLSSLVDYPARDMTITVEAGMRVADLERLLHEEGQQLPIDVPQADRATLGGILACNVSGSRRYGYGTLRDYLLGVTAVDGQGREFSAGGRVVKNVAGYDLCKLLIGSHGTLGVIAQLTLKLKPLPPRVGVLWATYDRFVEIEDVLRRLLTSSARPISIDVLNVEAARTIAADCRRSLPTDRPALLVGVEGAESDVAWQLSALTREMAPLGPDELFSLEDDDVRPLRRALTEFSTESDAPLSFKASLRPSCAMEFLDAATQRGIAALSHAGNGIVVGHFPEAPLSETEDTAQALKAAAERGDGHLSLLSSNAAQPGRPDPLPRTLPGWELMARLKSTFDPHRLLNPGCLFPNP